ncbi:MAG: hypothetical protein IJY94_01960 [Clostridia bacterium]|nr:hypothetical protein [Clostridia bacterium]
MKSFKKSALIFLLIVTILTFGVSADGAYSSKNDPLVSLSYVNDVLGPQIMSQVLSKIESDYVKISDLTDMSSGELTLITLNKGDTLMAKGVCEIVVLSGSATALITSSANVNAGQGLVDVTDGAVVTNGTLVALNHKIIIPKADGRGLVVTSDGISVLVRGAYTVAN